MSKKLTKKPLKDKELERRLQVLESGMIMLAQFISELNRNVFDGDTEFSNSFPTRHIREIIKKQQVFISFYD